MQHPEISIIMSVFNGARYLDGSVSSILNQSFANFEFIIIDDASEDNSSSIIKKFASQDQRIKIIKNDRNLGLTCSLNRGLKIARGKYIARQDADDLSLPERLRVQYSYLENRLKIFLVGSSAVLIDGQGKKIGHCLKKDNPQKTAQTLARRNCVLHPSIMFRNPHTNPLFESEDSSESERPKADDRGIYPPTYTIGGGMYREKFYYAQDYDLYLTLLTHGKKITNLPQCLIKYRYYRGSLSFKNLKIQKRFAQKAREFYNQRLKLRQDEYHLFNAQTIMEKTKNRTPLLPFQTRIFLSHLFRRQN